MKTFKNFLKSKNKYIWILIGGVLFTIATVSAAVIVSSNEVTFSSSRTDKANLHDAIEELYGMAVVDSCPYGQTCIRCGAGTYADQTNMTCSACVAGTYSLGGVNSCSSCPTGYTSDASATSQSACYIQTTAGKYIANAYDKTQTKCTANNYCPSTKVYYGSKGGIIACPDGYTKSVAGADSINKCYVTTTGGKYIKTAKATTQTQCPANSYCPSSTIYYGSTGKITACGSGKTSPAGSDEESDCKSSTVTRTGTNGYVGTYTCSGGTGTLTSCVLKTDTEGAFCRGQNGTAGTCTVIAHLASEPLYTCYCPDTYACKQYGGLTHTITC